jgi:hypothetical protein
VNVWAGLEFDRRPAPSRRLRRQNTTGIDWSASRRKAASHEWYVLNRDQILARTRAWRERRKALLLVAKHAAED